jgi:hypothetical protein
VPGKCELFIQVTSFIAKLFQTAHNGLKTIFCFEKRFFPPEVRHVTLVPRGTMRFTEVKLTRQPFWKRGHRTERVRGLEQKENGKKAKGNARRWRKITIRLVNKKEP